MTAADLKTYRDKRGLSQEALAHQLGVSVRTVARWESGKFNPSRLAEKFLLRKLK